jgi:predicted amidohydrolase
VLCLKHRKVNEVPGALPLYDQGDRLNVAHTEFGTIGLMICSDAFARDRVLSRALGHLGADIILSPSAWVVPATHDNTNQSRQQTTT